MNKHGASYMKTTREVIQEARALAIEQLRMSGGGIWFKSKALDSTTETEPIEESGMTGKAEQPTRAS